MVSNNLLLSKSNLFGNKYNLISPNLRLFSLPKTVIGE